MKKTTTTRIGASITALALATGAALATAAPASAATTVGDVTWYGASDFGAESGGYPATAWFFGDVATDGTAGFTANGLELGSDATSAVQILNQEVPGFFADSASFVDFIETLFADTTTNDFTYQVPLFGNSAGGEFTTLRAPGDDTSTWTTSRPIYDDLGGVVYAAGATASLDVFADALYGTTTAPELLAVGLRVGEGTGTTVQGFWIDDAYSAFTPVLTRSVTPNPITPADATNPDKGVTFSGSGFIPGEAVSLFIYPAGAGCTDPGDPSIEYVVGTDALADELGAVSISAVLPAGSPTGVYCVVFSTPYWYYLGATPDLELTVANVLPATGLEITAPIVGGIAFLVIGGLALVVTRKVERTAAS